ncbi:hypothetical protein GLOTRDRAFT_105784 [Gloeophyllum trabeum ATCC 11539]|uniref:Uncharacterized protein n=1 Tax=Gloeophyllum trabeum (strain ATCC 11539 / FP-39264 / Madison 617) TaxID=670483 RepID=S7Q772_GLOTA|nr:uncharacterized protein GLOTRDRAFT_105784 [Gloeophyllum trabeum ATCC 11539]EPQ55871.1 hypothetical protein GLOTRDRAFT_105784 [Gloeophyllum trabeum ATCC 11539]
MSASEARMWEDVEMGSIDFDCGLDPEEEERVRLEKAITRLWGAVDELDLAEDKHIDSDVVDRQWEDLNAEEDILADALENIKEHEQLTVDEIRQHAFGELPACSPGSEWFPYGSKTMFLLDMIDNLPRMRVSDSLMRIFIFVLKESGSKDVPSFDGLRHLQKQLREHCGIPTRQHQTGRGNIFYYNDVRTLIAKDWSTLAVRKHMHLYPVIPSGAISEVWHAEKFRKELDLDMLSPMYDAGQDHHYYVNEFARMKNGQFTVPIRWLERETDGEIVADAYAVRPNEDGTYRVDDTSTIIIETKDLEADFLDLIDRNLVPNCDQATTDAGHQARMPNPLREIAGGDPLYTSFIDYWSDDVSGNRSKSYNKHINACVVHRNLPRHLLQQEIHVHFVSTSQHASAPEQFRAFKETVEETHHEPVRVRDAKTGQDTRFRLFTNTGPGDNPLQSEMCGHIGGKGNYYCRKCNAGGTQEYKQTDEGYESLFHVGASRTAQATITEVERQFDAATTGVAKRVEELQTSTGVKDGYSLPWIDQVIDRAREMKKDRKRTAASINAELMEWVQSRRRDVINPVLTMKGFDPAKDTPVEILHTILLGIVKYTWHGTHSAWSDEQKKTYTIRLQSIDANGLSIHPIRAEYLMQYANSLIGRQLKTVAQVSIFALHDLVDPVYFLLWKACGELIALLWYPEIHDMDEYFQDLDVAVGNVLDTFAEIDPSKIITKMKLHLLPHIKDDIRRLGPILGEMDEIFECYNGVFRNCSPSRDIAINLACQEGFKHRILGGFWPSAIDNNGWECAGPSVRDYLQQHPIIQRHLGWSTGNDLPIGSIRLAAYLPGKGQRKRCTAEWESTLAYKAVNRASVKAKASSKWLPCKYVVSKTHEACGCGTWVVAESPIADPPERMIGRIVEILKDEGSDEIATTLERFDIGQTRDAIFGMPTLSRRCGEPTLIVVSASMIDFSINVLHNCQKEMCDASGRRAKIQERLETNIVETFIQHKSKDHYLINTHSLHNPHLLRQVLPRHLTRPMPRFQGENDRREKHAEFAAKLRADTDVKRKKVEDAKAQKQREDKESARMQQADDRNTHEQREAGVEALEQREGDGPSAKKRKHA